MSDDGEILTQSDAAFAGCPRPARFTDCPCAACAEHDAVFQSLDRDALREDGVGNPLRGLLAHLGPAGLGYFFPALARLVLAEPSPARDWLGVELLSVLTYAPQGKENRHLRGFDPGQRRAVADLLRHLIESRSRWADAWSCGDDLFYAVELWSESHDAEPGAATDPAGI